MYVPDAAVSAAMNVEVCIVLKLVDDTGENVPAVGSLILQIQSYKEFKLRGVNMSETDDAVSEIFGIRVAKLPLGKIMLHGAPEQAVPKNIL